MTTAYYKRLATDDRLLITGARTVNLTTGALAYLTDAATVTATVRDHATQVAVSGETWPVTLTYITGSDGDFHGPLRDTLSVTVGQRLDVVVVLDNGTDQKRTLTLPVIVVQDDGSF
jgi:FtsP/CotA-like multicopper oxidase with cupredoxin domain